jgi:hypothetical protein
MCYLCIDVDLHVAVNTIKPIVAMETAEWFPVALLSS